MIHTKAAIAVMMFGKDLVGLDVNTLPIGDWPGGRCTVVEINPDPGAPEISFTVSHPEHGEMGIFEGEPVTILK
jgi:hypothetical protein